MSYPNVPGKDLVKMAIAQLGSAAGVASALGVHATTVNRWLRGSHRVSGASRAALVAIIKHPGEYSHHYAEPGKPGRKPTAGK